MLTLKGWLMLATIGLGFGAVVGWSWCGSLLILMFIVVFSILWYRTLTGVGQRFMGTDPATLAAQRANELMIEVLESHRRQ
jgi:hypothetical protein